MDPLKNWETELLSFIGNGINLQIRDKGDTI